MSDSRKAFEAWYVTAAFDYERNPIGSRECGLQWAAWQAARRAALEEMEQLREALMIAAERLEARGHNMGAREARAAIRALAAQTGQEGK